MGENSMANEVASAQIGLPSGEGCRFGVFRRPRNFWPVWGHGGKGNVLQLGHTLAHFQKK